MQETTRSEGGMAGDGSAPSGTSTAPSNTLNYSEEAATRQEELLPRVRPRHLASSVWPLIFPTTLFCFLIFGFHPVLSQFVNQLECDRLGSADCDSEEVNKAAVRTNTFYLGVEYLCATIVMGTLSGLSDYVGRKRLMTISAAGQVVTVLLTLLAVGAGTYNASMVFIYMGCMAQGLSGSYGVFLMATYAYAADVTRDTKTARGKNFTLITGSIAAGNTLGPLISGLILHHSGYAAPLIFQLTCGLAGLVVIFLLRESQDPRDRPAEPFAPLRRHNTIAVLYRFLGPPSKELLKHRDEGHKRPEGDAEEPSPAGTMYYHRRPPSLWPLSACFCLIFSDAVGVGVLFLYYAKRAFRWGPDMIGYFDATGGATKAIVMFAILPVVYRRLIKGPPNDYLFAAFGLCCNILYFVLLALLPYSAAAFAILPISGLGQMCNPHIRSLFSLAVPPEVQGQLFGLMSALESIATAFTPWIVNQIYYSSPSNFPGLIWLVLASFLVVALFALHRAWLTTLPPTGGVTKTELSPGPRVKLLGTQGEGGQEGANGLQAQSQNGGGLAAV